MLPILFDLSNNSTINNTRKFDLNYLTQIEILFISYYSEFHDESALQYIISVAKNIRFFLLFFICSLIMYHVSYIYIIESNTKFDKHKSNGSDSIS